MVRYKLQDIVVLLVDDNRHTRALIRDLLRVMGVGRVIEATDGMTGFQQLRASEPDIVITDLMMQPVDGLQFVRMVRNERRSPAPFIPIIMVTGFSDKQRVEEARDAGVSEFLAKPVTIEALNARIETIINRPRPFIRTGDFFGPDRRRREEMPPPEGDRRADEAPYDGVRNSAGKSVPAATGASVPGIVRS
jgi:two-component system, chemotaxis family, chemotaxis protein CheY